MNTPATPATPEAGPNASFEDNLQALETLVNKLERNELPLQEALTAYAQGTALVKACQAQLAQAEVTLTEIGASLNAEPVA